jgi:hypothetical protein
MRVTLPLILTTAALLLVACNEPPTPGVPTAFASICDRANDGKRILYDGYLMLPDSFTGDTSLSMYLFETEEMEGDKIGVAVKFGNEANQQTLLTESYSDYDLGIHLAGDGGIAGFGEKLKVSGKVYFPPISPEYACALENPLFER